MKKILVLYTELADYIINSFEYYSENYNSEFHIVHWDINTEAPFLFSKNKNINLYNKNSFTNYSLLEFASKLKADAIICAGWMDSDYIKTIKSLSNKIPKILTMDNHWEGSIKQYILRAISPFYLKKIFSHIWVPGKPQKEYAKMLSFSENQILTGFYVANTDIFNKIKYKVENTFVFVGRYIEHKGIIDLWTAFTELKKELPNSWKLKCIGTGDLWENRIINDDIEHVGFLQPNNLLNHISGGVFILPSHFEPWGVVVHEFATAGFPIIVSDKVGSGTNFLNNNGFTFESGNIEDLKNKMKKIILSDADELRKMSNKSRKLSNSITNNQWAIQLENTTSKNK